MVLLDDSHPLIQTPWDRQFISNPAFKTWIESELDISPIPDGQILVDYVRLRLANAGANVQLQQDQANANAQAQARSGGGGSGTNGAAGGAQTAGQGHDPRNGKQHLNGVVNNGQQQQGGLTQQLQHQPQHFQPQPHLQQPQPQRSSNGHIFHQQHSHSPTPTPPYSSVSTTSGPIPMTGVEWAPSVSSPLSHNHHLSQNLSGSTSSFLSATSLASSSTPDEPMFGLESFELDPTPATAISSSSSSSSSTPSYALDPALLQNNRHHQLALSGAAAAAGGRNSPFFLNGNNNTITSSPSSSLAIDPSLISLSPSATAAVSNTNQPIPPNLYSATHPSSSSTPSSSEMDSKKLQEIYIQNEKRAAAAIVQQQQVQAQRAAMARAQQQQRRQQQQQHQRVQQQQQQGQGQQMRKSSGDNDASGSETPMSIDKREFRSLNYVTKDGKSIPASTDGITGARVGGSGNKGMKTGGTSSPIASTSNSNSLPSSFSQQDARSKGKSTSTAGVGGVSDPNSTPGVQGKSDPSSSQTPTQSQKQIQWEKDYNSIKTDISFLRLERAPTVTATHLSSTLGRYLTPINNNNDKDNKDLNPYGIDNSQIPITTRIEILTSLKEKASKNFFEAWVKEVNARDSVAAWLAAAMNARKVNKGGAGAGVAGKGDKNGGLTADRTLIHLLQVIDKMPYTVEHLRGVKLGKVISRLAKDTSSPAANKVAVRIEERWRDMAQKAKLKETKVQEAKKRAAEPLDNDDMRKKRKVAGETNKNKSTSSSSTTAAPAAASAATKENNKPDMSFLNENKLKALPGFTKKKVSTPFSSSSVGGGGGGDQQGPPVDVFQEALRDMGRKESSSLPAPPSSTSFHNNKGPNRKKKSVTFAPPEKLEQVRFIDRTDYDDEELDKSHSVHDARQLDISEGHAFKVSGMEEEIEWYEPLEIAWTQKQLDEQFPDIDSPAAETQSERVKSTPEAIFPEDQFPPTPSSPPPSSSSLSDEDSKPPIPIVYSQALMTDAEFQGQIALAQTAAATGGTVLSNEAFSGLLAQLNVPPPAPTTTSSTTTASTTMPTSIPSSTSGGTGELGASLSQLAATFNPAALASLNKLLGPLVPETSSSAQTTQVQQSTPTYSWPPRSAWEGPDAPAPPPKSYPDQQDVQDSRDNGWGSLGRTRSGGGGGGGGGRRDSRPPRKVVCRFWEKGNCQRGDECLFLHPE